MREILIKFNCWLRCRRFDLWSFEIDWCSRVNRRVLEESCFFSGGIKVGLLRLLRCLICLVRLHPLWFIRWRCLFKIIRFVCVVLLVSFCTICSRRMREWWVWLLRWLWRWLSREEAWGQLRSSNGKMCSWGCRWSTIPDSLHCSCSISRCNFDSCNVNYSPFLSFYYECKC